MGYRALRYYAEHVHFFCRPERDGKSLSEFAEFWKSYTSRKINAIGLSRPAVAAGVDRGRQCERRHPMMRNRSPVIFSPMSKFLLSPLHRSVYAFPQGCPHSFPLDVYRQRVSVRL